MNKISVVIPLYKCSSSLVELNDRLNKTLIEISAKYEIIYVVDGSPENEWEIIETISQDNKNVKGIQFSRNFGQHYAITAGLNYVKGDWSVVMDGDLQDQPEDIILLYQKVNSGFDVVFGRRVNRKDKLIRRLTSKMFYKIYNFFTDSYFDGTIANFSISSAKVIEQFIKINEIDRSFPLLIQWLGFKIGYVNVNHVKRELGKSTYNFIRLLNFSLSSIVSQSNKPLKIAIAFGFLFSILSFVLGVNIIYRKIFLGIPALGWASIIVSILFIGGLILATIGILGIYLGKVFNETKNRPLFIIKKSIGI
ncbi:putative glycosyltransferase [subsurface metagenome]